MNSSDMVHLEIRLGVVEKLLDGMGRKLEHMERSLMRLDIRVGSAPAVQSIPDEWEINNAEGTVEKAEEKKVDPDAELDAILGK